MAIPNEKLQQVSKVSIEMCIQRTLKERQLLQEISSKAAFAEQQLGIVRTQIASKNREQRMLQLSNKELSDLPSLTPVYDGVGKMYDHNNNTYAQETETDLNRFVGTTIPDVQKKQDKEAEDCKKELANLDKKLHYLETTYKNSQEHMEGILQRGG